MDSDIESLLILDTVDSTNNYAMGLVHKGLSNRPLVVMAIEQTSGKGRLEKEWISEKGKNLTASFIADIHAMAVYRQFELTVAVSLSCVDLFRTMGAFEVKIKWPNDIYYNDKKAGGILIENVIKGNMIKTSVIGIGINLNQTDFPESMNATSLSLITGETYDPKEICLTLNEMIRKRLGEINHIPFQKRLENYNDILFGKDLSKKLKKGNQVFETTIKKVDAEGRLITQDTLERAFQFDEIQWIID